MKDGRDVPQDYIEAAKWHRMAAIQGSVLAQNNLGLLHRYGLGVEQNYTEAVKWFQLAAEQGNEGAMSSLGFMYHEGLGVLQDDAAAVKWFQLAADRGEVEAQSSLSIAYDTGRGIKQNYIEAYKWAGLAASQGSERALGLRDSLAAKMNPDQIAAAERLVGEWQSQANIAPTTLSGVETAERSFREVQRMLGELGYVVGSAFSVTDPRMRDAIRKFQTQEGMPVTGEVSDDLLARLEQRVRTGEVPASDTRIAASVPVPRPAEPREPAARAKPDGAKPTAVPATRRPVENTVSTGRIEPAANAVAADARLLRAAENPEAARVDAAEEVKTAVIVPIPRDVDNQVTAGRDTTPAIQRPQAPLELDDGGDSVAAAREEAPEVSPVAAAPAVPDVENNERDSAATSTDSDFAAILSSLRGGENKLAIDEAEPGENEAAPVSPTPGTTDVDDPLRSIETAENQQTAKPLGGSEEDIAARLAMPEAAESKLAAIPPGPQTVGINVPSGETSTTEPQLALATSAPRVANPDLGLLPIGGPVCRPVAAHTERWRGVLGKRRAADDRGVRKCFGCRSPKSALSLAACAQSPAGRTAQRGADILSRRRRAGFGSGAGKPGLYVCQRHRYQERSGEGCQVVR